MRTGPIGLWLRRESATMQGMAGSDIALVPEDVSDLDDDRQHDGRADAEKAAGEPEDPAGFAARVIAEQALSIFQAVEARTLEIKERARRQADEIVREANAVATPALARLEALSRDLGTLSIDLDHAAEERAARRVRGR
jgi:hypothetical protein